MGAGLSLGYRAARPRGDADGGLTVPSATASQTIGPFWHLIEHPKWADLTRLGATGPQVTLTGAIIDRDGNPVTDAAVELWQYDPSSADRLSCFGRSRSAERGR